MKRSVVASTAAMVLIILAGAAGAAQLVADIVPGAESSAPAYLTVFNGELYFKAYDSTRGYELWKYDGTSASLVEDILPGN